MECLGILTMAVLHVIHSIRFVSSLGGYFHVYRISCCWAAPVTCSWCATQTTHVGYRRCFLCLRVKKRERSNQNVLTSSYFIGSDVTFDSLMPRLCRLKSQLMNQQPSSRSIKTWDAKIASGSLWHCHLAKKSCWLQFNSGDIFFVLSKMLSIDWLSLRGFIFFVSRILKEFLYENVFRDQGKNKWGQTRSAHDRCSSPRRKKLRNSRRMRWKGPANAINSEPTRRPSGRMVTGQKKE